MAYLKEIDALRAIAVGSVLLYHAKVPGFTGGFVGVDVFFVISGFLITQVIISARARAEFTYTRFFASRIRRIVPAYAAVVLAVAACAVALHLPREVLDIGQSMIAAAAFATNILYWKEASYFAAAAEIKPLLHTWSLAVEAQFYLIYPLILGLLYRLNLTSRSALAVFALFIILTFALSEAILRTAPTAAFYLMPARIWEFGVGAILTMAPQRSPSSLRLNGALSLIGLGLIAIAVVTYTEDTAFPGASALLPCVGAAVVIFAGSPSWGPARLLNAAVLTFIGRISYSLYLVHWPVFAIWRYINVEPLTPVQTALAIAASFGLAVLSYSAIETPFRKAERLPDRRAIGFLSLSSATVAAVGLIFILSNGLPGRLPSGIASLIQEQKPARLDCVAYPGNWIAPKQACVLGAPGRPVTAALWGDSHAHALLAAASETFAEQKMAMQFFGYTGCPPVPLILRAKGGEAANQCSAYYEAVREYLLQTPSISIVIIAARHQMYVEGDSGQLGPSEGMTGPKVKPVAAPDLPTAPLGAAYAARLTLLVHELAKAGKTVVLVKPVPEVGYDVPTTLALQRWSAPDVANELSRPMAMYNDRTASFAAAFDPNRLPPSAIIIDPTLDFCDATTCRTVRDGKPLYYDDDHVSLSGARIMARRMQDALFGPIAVRK